MAVDVREKLVGLIDDALQRKEGMARIVGKRYVNTIANHLAAHGVTVHEGKTLEAFLHPIDVYKGLKAKYLVFKADTGEIVDNCFVLRPDKDAAAVEALRAYAKVTDNKTLAKDIYNWVGDGVTVQEWISVKERLPEEDGHYLCNYHFGEYPKMTFTQVLDYYATDIVPHFQHTLGDGSMKVTHWMEIPKLPQPPKGE